MYVFVLPRPAVIKHKGETLIFLININDNVYAFSSAINELFKCSYELFSFYFFYISLLSLAVYGYFVHP